jgi:hypothetical protein
MLCRQPPVQDGYVDIRGRTKSVVRGQISDHIPKPDLRRGRRAPRAGGLLRHGNPDRKTYREALVKPIKAIPAFREPGPRRQIRHMMNELGLDYALMFTPSCSRR